jgi:hypothetical protein
MAWAMGKLQSFPFDAVKFLVRKYQRMGRWFRVFIIGQQECFGDFLGKQAEPRDPTHSRRTKETKGTMQFSFGTCFLCMY